MTAPLEPLKFKLRRKVAIPLPTSLGNKLALVFCFAFIASCSTAPNKNANEGQVSELEAQGYSSILYVEHDGKSYKLKSEISILSASAVRFDLLTSLDYPLASVVITDKEIQYAIFRDKKFYKGKPNPHALDPVFPLAVDVKTLSALLTEKKIDGAKCQIENDRPTKCQGATGGTKYEITWDKRQTAGPLAGRATKITLDLPERNTAVRFYLTDWQHHVPNAERLFALQVPPGFQIISVPQR